jgi:mitochondrial Rho GTPase 1
MYDFHNPNSLNKIKFELLPLLNSAENINSQSNDKNEKIYSIIIVGNKIDLLDLNTQKFVIEQDKTEIEKYQEDFTVNLKYFYISCKNYSNISPLFSEMLNSLVNPSHLFYYQKNEEIIFKENFEKGLKRIFRIFDKDRKGVLSRNEFNKIHQSIFDIKLESDHFLAIKECIKIVNSFQQGQSSNNNPSLCSSGTTYQQSTSKNILGNEDEITADGFITLNKLTVQVGESQTTWSTLRKFGYNDNLELDNWYFKAKKLQKIDTNEYILELSDQAKNLLTGLFLQFKCKSESIIGLDHKNSEKYNTNFITLKEWNEIFSTMESNPDFTFENILNKNLKLEKNSFYNSESIKDKDKSLSLDDWVFIWNCYTRLNYEEAFKTFLYLGFDIEFDQFIKKIRKSDVNYFNSIESSHSTIHICYIAQEQDNSDNFFKKFSDNNVFSLVQSGGKQRELIIKTSPYSIIVKSNLFNIIHFYNIFCKFVFRLLLI